MPEPTPPISPAQRHELDAADVREARFALASKLAAFNSVGLGLCAAFAFVSALFDPTAVIVAAVLGVFAFVEARGRTLLLDYEPRGLRWLWINQAVLVALVWLYAGAKIYVALRAPSPVAEVLRDRPELAEALDGTDIATSSQQIYQTGIVMFYAAVIAATTVFQGGAALYYFTRRTALEAFLRDTPAWVVDWKRSRRA